MRKFIILIVSLIWSLTSFSQMPTDGNYSNWDWENQNVENWKRRTEESYPDGTRKWDYVQPPFHYTSGRVDLMDDIWRYSDYTKEKGWYLVWANFYEHYPFFILYNRHKGLMRVFFYRTSYGNELFKHFAVTLNFKGKKSALFSFGNEYKQATDKYLLNTSSGDDVLTTVIPVVNVGQWGCAQFSMFFDDNVIKENCDLNNPIYAGSRIEARVYGVLSFDVSLNGKIVTLNPKGTSMQGGAYNGSNQIEMTNAKLISELKNLTNMVSDAKKSFEGINDSSPKYLQTYKKNLQPLVNDIGGLVQVASGISNTLGVAFGLYNTVMGLLGENQSSTFSATTSEISLQGTITTQAPLTGDAFKVPGVCTDQYLNKIPYYDCSIGLINLNKTPKIKVSKPYLRRPSTPNVKGCYGMSYHYTLNLPNDKYVKYKFDDNINVVQNKMDDVQLIDIKFAIVCKANDKTPEEIACVFSPDFCVLASVGPRYRSYKNPIWSYLNSGKFILHKKDTSNAENDYYGSPYLNYEQLKGFSFEAHSYTEVYLGVIAKFKALNHEEPIFVKALYQLDKVVVSDNVVDPITGNNEQPLFLLSDYYRGEVMYELNSNNNFSSYTAGEIILSPGFVGVSGFAAISNDPYPSGPPITPEFLPYTCRNYDINVNKLLVNGIDNKRLNEQYPEEEMQGIENIRVYPNPTDGELNISLLTDIDESGVHIEIYNLNGSLMYSEKFYSDNCHLDLKNYNNGLYLLRIIYNNKSKLFKILKQN